MSKEFFGCGGVAGGGRRCGRGGRSIVRWLWSILLDCLAESAMASSSPARSSWKYGCRRWSTVAELGMMAESLSWRWYRGLGPPLHRSRRRCLQPKRYHLRRNFHLKKLPAALKKLPFDTHLSQQNMRKIISEADGYQPHLIAMSFTEMELAAMEVVEISRFGARIWVLRFGGGAAERGGSCHHQWTDAGG